MTDPNQRVTAGALAVGRQVSYPKLESNSTANDDWSDDDWSDEDEEVAVGVIVIDY